VPNDNDGGDDDDDISSKNSKICSLNSIRGNYTVARSKQEKVMVMVKVKFTPEHATKAHRGSKGITLLFL